jgi:hypothetical protein
MVAKKKSFPRILFRVCPECDPGLFGILGHFVNRKVEPVSDEKTPILYPYCDCCHKQSTRWFLITVPE